MPNAIPSNIPSPRPTETSCNDVIDSCDKALEAKNAEIAQVQIIVDKLDRQNAELNKQVDDKDAKLNSPIRKPFLMIGLGSAISLIIGSPAVIIIGILGGIIF